MNNLHKTPTPLSHLFNANMSMVYHGFVVASWKIICYFKAKFFSSMDLTCMCFQAAFVIAFHWRTHQYLQRGYVWRINSFLVLKYYLSLVHSLEAESSMETFSPLDHLMTEFVIKDLNVLEYVSLAPFLFYTIVLFSCIAVIDLLISIYHSTLWLGSCMLI